MTLNPGGGAGRVTRSPTFPPFVMVMTANKVGKVSLLSTSVTVIVAKVTLGAASFSMYSAPGRRTATTDGLLSFSSRTVISTVALLTNTPSLADT